VSVIQTIEKLVSEDDAKLMELREAAVEIKSARMRAMVKAFLFLGVNRRVVIFGFVLIHFAYFLKLIGDFFSPFIGYFLSLRPSLGAWEGKR
jgi:hypothetical protein